MIRTMNRLLLSALVCGCLLATGTAVAGPILIAHPGVPDDALSAGDVQKVFLGKTANWSDGSSVKLCTLDGGPTADAFLKGVVKKSPKQFSTFWRKAVFSGTGEMPAQFDTEAELAAFVAGTPGAVGFVDEATDHDGVKVIAIR